MKSDVILSLSIAWALLQWWFLILSLLIPLLSNSVCKIFKMNTRITASSDTDSHMHMNTQALLVAYHLAQLTHPLSSSYIPCATPSSCIWGSCNAFCVLPISFLSHSVVTHYFLLQPLPHVLTKCFLFWINTNSIQFKIVSLQYSYQSVWKQTSLRRYFSCWEVLLRSGFSELKKMTASGVLGSATPIYFFKSSNLLSLHLGNWEE